MRTRRLGRTAVEVTELGFGTGPIGGLFEAPDDKAAAGALSAAREHGIRYFDTAPHYGIGHAERVLGEFVRDVPREGITLSTKVGRLLVPQDPDGRTDESFRVPAAYRREWDFSRDGVLRSVEESLERTGVDRFDVLYLHDAEDHFEDALRTGMPALAELRDQGLVGAVGAGMHDTAKLTRLVREHDVDVVMLSGRWTLLDQRAAHELLPACAERDVSLLAASVFNSGLLSTPRPSPDATFDYAAAPPETVRRAHRIADVCESHGVTLPEAALAFPLRHPAVAGVVVGMRTAEEVRADLAAFGKEIPERLWSDLLAEGLLDPRA
jgi:D-threo-aldose 1-dehydrogenase